MPTHIIEFDDLMLESDIYSLMEKLDEVSEHIKRTIPDEIIFLPNGEPNVRTRWGAVYFHVRMARSSLRAFM